MGDITFAKTRNVLKIIMLMTYIRSMNVIFQVAYEIENEIGQKERIKKVDIIITLQNALEALKYA